MDDRAQGHVEVTRSEEELVAHTVWRPHERVRLVRHVVEEEVTIRVPVRREELRVEREPVSRFGDPHPDGDLGPDEELVIPLREERPVVGTEVVVREQVRVRKERVLADRVEVSAEVGREEVVLERERGV
jgi:uncharacterized protein (TIGR02271 family)